MKTDKEQWIDEVLDSLSGSEKARPDPGLFTKITARLEAPETRTISLSQRRIGMVAAIILLIINVISLRLYLQDDNSDYAASVAESEPIELIFDFKIYE